MDNEAEGWIVGQKIQDALEAAKKLPNASVERANRLRMAKLKGTMASYKIGDSSYVEIQFSDPKDAQSFYDLLEAL